MRPANAAGAAGPAHPHGAVRLGGALLQGRHPGGHLGTGGEAEFGENFRFGGGGRGDTALLEAAGERLGFTVDAVRLVAYESRTCSSTLIRGRLAAGDLRGAGALLGRLRQPRRPPPAGPARKPDGPVKR